MEILLEEIKRKPSKKVHSKKVHSKKPHYKKSNDNKIGKLKKSEFKKVILDLVKSKEPALHKVLKGGNILNDLWSQIKKISPMNVVKGVAKGLATGIISGNPILGVLSGVETIAGGKKMSKKSSKLHSKKLSKKVHFKGGSTTMSNKQKKWIDKVKKYSEKHKITYKEALVKLGKK